MIPRRIKQKLHNIVHPTAGEIWMLHRVVKQRSEEPEQRVLEVTPEWLKQKILEYKEKGFSFVSIDNLPKHSRWVCVTFDDGYRDNYTLAYPLLKTLGIPFTVYVTTGFIDNQMPMWWYPDKQLGLSVDEIKQLDKETFCTIGAHTVSHPKLDMLPYEQQYKEIEASIRLLEQLLNHPIHHFSLPHGAYSNDTLEICRNLGLRSVVTSWGGTIRHGISYNPFPRVNIIQP